jgi:DNA-binding response OmpR family regulator
MTQILIVEHDRLFADALACTLRCEGYEVLTAVGAAEGIQLGLESNPDVVIAAWSLGGGLPGCEVCRRILAVRTEARAILVADHQDAAARVRQHCRDFASVIVKPFHKDDILKAIRRALSGGATPWPAGSPPHYIQEGALDRTEKAIRS